MLSRRAGLSASAGLSCLVKGQQVGSVIITLPTCSPFYQKTIKSVYNYCKPNNLLKICVKTLILHTCVL